MTETAGPAIYDRGCVALVFMTETAGPAIYDRGCVALVFMTETASPAIYDRGCVALVFMAETAGPANLFCIGVKLFNIEKLGLKISQRNLIKESYSFVPSFPCGKVRLL